ncbi:MAG TPA: CDP-diacylglycerol--glycerol-3-phosphate 3-phosphatidyltransferase [Syntrophobacteraceae bacterium]|nr:CDP-diacylglycerol--glycerol-3-phosphate 3-phosphatidyltransferase [Syntrophobacteraceae bacterium]
MITVTRGGFSRKDLTSIPNVLTYLRIATIPVILVVLTPPASQESLNMACALFVAASITDYLDGILARRHNQVTSIGKLLDPLADKLLTSAVMVMLIPLGKIPAWLVFIIIGRDTTITGLRSIAASQGLIIDASRMGKNKMISQTVGLSFLLLSITGVQHLLDTVGMVFIWISVVLSCWSARDYCRQFFRQAKRHDLQND